ncbi:MAG: DnaD domain protein [Bacilli bacterium]|nr:DnaD domain protein [Bacilli bacterium]
MKLNENTLATIFVIEHLISQGNPFITADLLSFKMSLDVKEIDKILADLINKGYLEYNVSGSKTVCSLNPLKEKLYEDFENSVSRDDVSESDREVSSNVKKATKEIEKMFVRQLSPLEVSKVKEWIMTGYRVETIVDACKECLSKGKKTIRSMDKVLTIWQSRNDIETDGITTISPDWNKSLEETIKIAKTPWLDQDEKSKK